MKNLRFAQIIRPRLNTKKKNSLSNFPDNARKRKAERERSIVRFDNGDTRRFNEFHRESDRYRHDRKIQLFSFYFFFYTTQERFLTSVLIRGIKAITHVVSRLRARAPADGRTL